MTKREAAEIILAGRKAAIRRGHSFDLDRARLAKFGLGEHEIAEVELTVSEIETFVAGKLEALNNDQPACETCQDDPAVCAAVPGLRHCEKANRDNEQT
ncbi:hypothetical protein [Pseudorhodoplanes sp.]|uniref:hypothetical protein n=1 Tax=Pseudorhodoplanes sp. TaxID=1934341 RepID=UPI002C70A287|nr:hypothetical protein [Pseudorhodoplanes sp.]HWV44155.1 hypothetical protein [Pseudorhodoplanes sp.]